jgi:ADP-heptose:LPS heptosyltransferase
MRRILISRTDSIGDVMLTLPICVWLKDHFIDAELIYLGRGYTKPIVNCFSVIDRFIDWEAILLLPTAEKLAFFRQLELDAVIHVFPNKDIASIMKKVKIPIRIGTSHRGFHLLTCNERVSFSRKNSELHESQLNFELLRPLGLKRIPKLSELKESLDAFIIPSDKLPVDIEALISGNINTVILHPKSQGSAIEWPLASFIALANKLTHKGYKVFFTGTEKEGQLFRDQLSDNPEIFDLSGKLDLSQLIRFISLCKNLVACSTGPLHIAGFSGIRTIGLYSSRRPIHPGRWAALGKNVRILTNDENCPDCKKKKSCTCLQKISVDKVLDQIA